jgi:hypothetical protein
MPTNARIDHHGVHMRCHRRAHLSIVVASGLIGTSAPSPWLNDLSLTMSA